MYKITAARWTVSTDVSRLRVARAHVYKPSFLGLYKITAAREPVSAEVSSPRDAMDHVKKITPAVINDSLAGVYYLEFSYLAILCK